MNFGPQAMAATFGAASVDYDRAIADAGGIDLQILAIGTDSHVAFNEPRSSMTVEGPISSMWPATASKPGWQKL